VNLFVHSSGKDKFRASKGSFSISEVEVNGFELLLDLHFDKTLDTKYLIHTSQKYHIVEEFTFDFLFLDYNSGLTPSFDT
jgi:hypothetical protein